jgi:ABC-type enterobactin transport system permease subunit
LGLELTAHTTCCWLSQDVLWSHVHDDYQSWLAWRLVRIVPEAGWQALQYLTLAFEVGAPLWFAVRRTRLPARFVGLGMHAMIGLMFGPVVWFALLMAMRPRAGCFVSFARAPRRRRQNAAR